jgi:hypothetical protein
MNVAVFGSFGKRMLAPGWTKETAVAFFGSGEFDLTQVEPGGNARFIATAVFGGINIIVDEGTRVTMSGFSLLGRREVEVVAGDGAAIQLHAIAVFGHIKVKPPPGE